MTNQEALDYLSWGNGEPQAMNFAGTLLRKAVRTLKSSKHLLRDYEARLLRITAEHLEVPLD